MQTAFQTYITRLNGAVSADDFGDTMGDMIAAYGLSRFAYLGISEHGRPPVYVTTYPETWTRHYLSHNYQGIDRVVADVRDSLLPFHWDAANPGRDTSVAQRRIFGEATEFGIVSGFTVPIHDSRGRIAAVTFASERPSSVLQRVINERPTSCIWRRFISMRTRARDSGRQRRSSGPASVHERSPACSGPLKEKPLGRLVKSWACPDAQLPFISRMPNASSTRRTWRRLSRTP